MDAIKKKRYVTYLVTKVSFIIKKKTTRFILHFGTIEQGTDLTVLKLATSYGSMAICILLFSTRLD